MLYIGIDPSFTKTGVCYLDTDTKKITFVPIKPEGKNEDYNHILKRSFLVVEELYKHINLWTDKVVIIEEPLLTSMRASSLGVLSGVLVRSLLVPPVVDDIYSINPHYISNLNRKVKKRLDITKKAASQHVASEILNYLTEEYKYEVELYTEKVNKDGSKRKRKLSHDEAEAFLLVVTFLVYKGFFNEQDRAKLRTINRKLLDTPNISKLTEGRKKSGTSFKELQS